jgi:hypothetical protein
MLSYVNFDLAARYGCLADILRIGRVSGAYLIVKDPSMTTKSGGYIRIIGGRIQII